MNPDPTDREPNAGFGDGWEPDPEALRVATHYLVHMPDQGDWPWEDHCEGLAGGILHALHESGYQIVPKVELEGLRTVKGAADVTRACLRRYFSTTGSGEMVVQVSQDLMAAADSLAAALQALDKENG